jgi:hypothetical protein
VLSKKVPEEVATSGYDGAMMMCSVSERTIFTQSQSVSGIRARADWTYPVSPYSHSWNPSALSSSAPVENLPFRVSGLGFRV